jgi:calcineurin-like phosphoesterase family protein
MVQQWNSTVRPCDKVIHLGDVCINKKYLPILNRLNGKKKLVLGNHDLWATSILAEYFYEQKAYRVFDKFIFSHIPVHTGSKGRFLGNIHGHLHDNKVMDEQGNLDQWYLCCCVEQEHINYTPIPWYRAKEIIAKNKESTHE